MALFHTLLEIYTLLRYNNKHYTRLVTGKRIGYLDFLRRVEIKLEESL